ncbi:MAG TPA: PAS domain-containing protein [Methanoregulaceae archaeon]|nr:PAS domain-containing protein [Methanoregulaceae archaeon]
MLVTPQLSLSAIRQPAFLYGPDGRITAANDLAEVLAGRSLAGRSIAAVVGIFDVRSPDGTPLMAADLPTARALTGEEAVDVPLAVTVADGRTLHVLVTAAPIRNGGEVVGAFSIWQDMSVRERMRAESETAAEELRAQQAELREQGDELHRAYADLDRQRQLLDAIVRTVPSRISLWAADGHCLWANDTMMALVGRARDDLIGRSWQEIGMDPRVVAPVMEAVGVVVATGVPRRNELEYPSADGPRWLEYEIAPFRNPGGTVTAALVVSRDITDRMKVDETLRRRLEELETLTETVPVAIWVSQDSACGEITGNRMANELYEVREGENVSAGSPPSKSIPPRRFFAGGRELSAEELPMQVAAAHGVEVRDAEIEVLLPSGRRIFMLGSASPLREASGAVRGCLGAFLDITERKRTEEALRESEERLRLAQETAHVSVWDRDVRTGRLTNTPELLRLYGFDEDLIDTYDGWREHVHPDDIGWVEAEREAALARSESFDLEYRILRPSGEVRWLSSIGRGYRDASGEIGRVLGVAIDITERKTAELALARSAADLQRSNEELQRFAYVASHDLQEPLRSIVSFSQLLERRYKGKLDADADEFIGFIVEGGNRMQRLIMDLLRVSRIETTAKPLKPTDAGAVVAGAIRLLDSPLREAGATLEIDDLPVVRADAAQLEQVFVNLIGNAIKYRRPDVPLEVRISARRERGGWELAVQDNGIGIEEEYFDRIFQMFQRLHTYDEFSGTGIGLAVVKKIVERHGGTIRVESTPGEGSTFFFTLPAA